MQVGFPFSASAMAKYLSLSDGSIFQQTENALGWLVDFIGKSCGKFPDAAVDRFRMETGIDRLDFREQFRPAQTLRMPFEQSERRFIYASCDRGLAHNFTMSSHLHD